VMPLLLPPVSNRSLVSANGELMALICMQRVHKNNQEKHQDRKSQQTI
jgi:hypothetical protein